VKRNQESTRRSRYTVAILWIVAAFGLLAVGVIAEAMIASTSWGWTFPTAGFVGYVFAFRRGLLVWSPQGIAAPWQRALEGGWGVGPMTRSTKKPQDERPEARLVRGAFQREAAMQNPDARPRRL
jgi:hypothetical protein